MVVQKDESPVEIVITEPSVSVVVLSVEVTVQVSPEMVVVHESVQAEMLRPSMVVR